MNVPTVADGIKRVREISGVSPREKARLSKGLLITIVHRETYLGLEVIPVYFSIQNVATA